jgi:hypothetical protein
MNQNEKIQPCYVMSAFVGVMLCIALTIGPVSAGKTIDNMYDLPSRYSGYPSYQGSTSEYVYPMGISEEMNTRLAVASRYGLNPIYLQNSSYPGAHTVYNMTLDIMCLPGVNVSYVQESLKNVNPFYKFRFVAPDPARYKLSTKTGLFESGHLGTIVISQKSGQCAHCGCGTTGQCCPVSLWIDTKKPVPPSTFGDIVEMECDHLLGPVSPDGTDTHQYTSEQVSAAYTEQSKNWGTVKVNKFTGSGTTSWTVYI